MTAEELRLSQTYMDTLNEAEAIALFSLIQYMMTQVESGQVSPEDGSNISKGLLTGQYKKPVKDFATKLLNAQATGAAQNVNDNLSPEATAQIIAQYEAKAKEKTQIPTKVTKPETQAPAPNQSPTSGPGQGTITISGPGIGTFTLTGPGIETKNNGEIPQPDKDFEIVGGKPRFMPEK